jgi:putative addiction module antidote
MSVTVKIRKSGNSMSVILPKEVLARLNVKEGDELFMVETQDGYSVTRHDPKFARTMEVAERVFDRFKNAYRELAKK